jgi:acetyl-CoA acetyltransferase
MADPSSDTVVVAVARTPFGKFEGALYGVDAPHLGALAIDEITSEDSSNGLDRFASSRKQK